MVGGVGFSAEDTFVLVQGQVSTLWRRYHVGGTSYTAQHATFHAVFRGSLAPLLGLPRYTEFTVYGKTEGGVSRADRGFKPRVKVVRGGIDAPERPWPPGELL